MIIIENNKDSDTDINPNYKLISAKLVGLNRTREIKIDYRTLKPKDDDEYFTKDDQDNIKINKEIIKIKCNGIVGNYF